MDKRLKGSVTLKNCPTKLNSNTEATHKTTDFTTYLSVFNIKSPHNYMWKFLLIFSSPFHGL